MADFSVHVTVSNNTKETLYKKDASAKWGHWEKFPEVIVPQAKISFQLVDPTTLAGAEGSFEFSVDQTDNLFSTYQTCPWGSSANVIRIDSSPKPKAVYITPFRGSVDNKTWIENGVPTGGHPVYAEYRFEYEKKKQYKFRLVSITAKTDHPVRNSRNELVRPNNIRKIWDSSNPFDWTDSNKGSFQPNVFKYDFGKTVSSSITVTIQALDLELIGAECFLYGTIETERVFQSDFFFIKAINTDIPVTVAVIKPKSSDKPFVWNGDVEWGMELRLSQFGVQCVGPRVSTLELYWVAQTLHRAFQNGIPVGFLRHVLPRATSTVAPQPHTLAPSAWREQSTRDVFNNNHKIYDTIDGAAAFGVWAWGGIFSLGYYLAPDVSGIPCTLYRYVNCMDQAAMLELTTSVGDTIGSWLVQQPFGYIERTKLVGVVDAGHTLIDVNNPFFGTDISLALLLVNDLRRTPFWMHVYNGSSKPFDPHSATDVIYDACGGPHTGTETAANYLATSIDRTTTLYTATVPNTYPGILANIVEGHGVTGIDGASFPPPLTVLERLPEVYRKSISDLLTLSAVEKPVSESHLHWAHVPEWIKHVLGDRWDVAFGQVNAGNATAHAFWHLQCNEENGIQFKASVHVETHAGDNQLLDVARSASAARDRLALILMSTDRNPADLWVPGTLSNFGQHSLQYADHIPAGRIVVVSGNVLVDISGASSTAALESYARKLLEHTGIRDHPPLRVATVRCPSIETAEHTDGRESGTSRTVVNGVNSEFSLRFELSSSVAAANANVEGAGILVDNHVIEEVSGNGSVVIFTFVSQELGSHTVNVHFADSLTLVSATKKVAVEVVDSDHGGAV